MADYRTGQPKCPGCRANLEPRIAGDAEVDVCPDCSGLWVDWFDGELVAVARAAAPLREAQIATAQRVGACPRCATAMSPEPVTESDALIHRCGECAGTFIPRVSLEAVTGVIERAPEASLLGRLLAALRALEIRW